jgi:uncharacterized membrane protein
MSQFYRYGQEHTGQNQCADAKVDTLQGNDGQQHEYQRPQESVYSHGQQYEVPMPGLHYVDPGSYEIGSRFAAFLSYSSLWLTGLLFLLFEHRNRLVRFHALQSLLFFGGVNVLYILLISIMVNGIPFLVGPAIFAFVLLNVVAFVAWIVGMVGAIRGKYVKLPFVGDLAERYVSRDVREK